MKLQKASLLFVLAATLTLTACGGAGKEIDLETAEVRAEEIDNKDATFGDNYTIEVTSGSSKEVLKINGTDKVMYSYSKDEAGKVEESYIGLKDSAFYTFDVAAKTYTVQESATLAGLAWDLGSAAIKLTATALTSAYGIGEIEGYISQGAQDGIKYYSKGAGNLSVKITKDSQDYTITYNNYLLESVSGKVKEDDGTVQDVSLKVSTSAKVSLPSTNGYTKE